MGETRVDLLHLLEDLADAYPGDLEETVLTEIIANALDSGASAIELRTDAANATLIVIDDGVGMRRAELRRYHDVAASAKTRGEGIGFAGVGIKLGLLVSDEVVTESRRGKDHIATSWALVKRQRAPWRWIIRCPLSLTLALSRPFCAATSSRCSIHISPRFFVSITHAVFASRSMVEV